jgi:hypothetical protein
MASLEVDPAFVSGLGDELREALSPAHYARFNLEQMPPQLGVGDVDGGKCDEAYANAVVAWQDDLRRCEQLLEGLSRRLHYVAVSRYDAVERANYSNLRSVG